MHGRTTSEVNIQRQVSAKWEDRVALLMDDIAHAPAPSHPECLDGCLGGYAR